MLQRSCWNVDLCEASDTTNLISIITCCSSIDVEGNQFRALVFDFMPNYSLHWWLHPSSVDIKKGHVLGLVQMFNIAVDTSALWTISTIAVNRQSSTVISSQAIRDFSLVEMLLDPGSHVENTGSTIGLRGTIGYVGPGNSTISGSYMSTSLELQAIKCRFSN